MFPETEFIAVTAYQNDKVTKVAFLFNGDINTSPPPLSSLKLLWGEDEKVIRALQWESDFSFVI